MNQQDVFQLIQDLTGQKNLLAIPRLFVDKLGDYPSAAMLAQCIYWCSIIEPEGWFYKTYKEWQDEICLSRDQAIKASNKLKKLGLIETKVKKAPTGNPTVFYRVDFDVLCSWIVVKPYYRKSDSTTVVSSRELLSSITETTTEIKEEEERCLGELLNNENIFGSHMQSVSPIQSPSDDSDYDKQDIQKHIDEFTRFTGTDLSGKFGWDIYMRWRYDWGFSHEMIMMAGQLMRQLAKTPNVSYVDRILHDWMNRHISSVSQATHAIELYRVERSHKSFYPPVAKKAQKNNICETTQSEYKIYVPPG